MIRYGLAVLLLLSSSWVEASARPARTQKVTYPDGRVVYESTAAKASDKPEDKAKEAPKAEQIAQADTAPAGQPTAEKAPTPADGSPVSLLQSPSTSDPKLPCDNCGDGGTTPTGDCKQYNPPRIIPGSDANCQGNCVPVPNPNPQIGHLGEVPGKPLSFYGNCVKFRANALIPIIVKNQQEKLFFGKVKYGEKCCQYEVCVVTACCCIETRNCELRSKAVDMRACRRNTDGTIDVYVLNEPGFPEQWVLYLGLTTAEFQAKFPGVTPP